ncbi:MAG TPA: hypothetical protein VJ371_21900, partial [Streptosporangiaceae bacterium]|nr:hypothetical protein [Streptosporangiaceae bacterium]
MDSHAGQRDPDSALILEGIQALHIRMDELEGRVMPADLAATAGPAATAAPASHLGATYGGRFGFGGRFGLGFVP